MNLFRKLTPKEESKFKAWARSNYKPGEPIEGIWHPVVQEECVQMNREWALAQACAHPLQAIMGS